MELKLKVLQYFLIYVAIVISENSFKMKNNAILLSSVYDAMKSNLLNKNEVLNDYRNKRNVNERWDFNNHGAASNEHRNEEWTPISSGSELICSTHKQKAQPDYAQKISIFDTNIPSIIYSIMKFILAAIAIISLPAILIQAFLLPIKVLLGIKTMAVANSLLMGTILWRYLNRKSQEEDDSETDNGTNNIVDSAVASSSHVPVVEDYPDMGESDIQRILKFVKQKNKNW